MRTIVTSRSTATKRRRRTTGAVVIDSSSETHVPWCLYRTLLSPLRPTPPTVATVGKRLARDAVLASARAVAFASTLAAADGSTKNDAHDLSLGSSIGSSKHATKTIPIQNPWAVSGSSCSPLSVRQPVSASSAVQRIGLTASPDEAQTSKP
ncbi:MAG: hypothetical protein KGL39_35865 [Patescibacteria group bacterium]|nr:hypothetical protein [Patescibacteria group bacterium]